MAWRGQGWTRWAMAGLALVVAGVGIVVLLFHRGGSGPGFGSEWNVIYGEANGSPLRLDIYRPRGPKKTRPAVFLLHGGGWCSGDKATLSQLARGFAQEGYIAIAVGYRLAKDDASRYPAQVADVRRAVQWVRFHADYVGIDPTRLGAFGHSAGGHLASLLGTTDVGELSGRSLAACSSQVTCVVDCCGPTDFTNDASPPLGPEAAWMVPNLFGKTRAEIPEVYRNASPLLQINAKTAPTLILHGTADGVVPIDQSRKFRDALRKAGIEVDLVEIEGEGHVFESQRARERMLQETLAFFRRHLKP